MEAFPNNHGFIFSNTLPKPIRLGLESQIRLSGYNLRYEESLEQPQSPITNSWPVLCNVYEYGVSLMICLDIAENCNAFGSLNRVLKIVHPRKTSGFNLEEQGDWVNIESPLPGESINKLRIDIFPSDLKIDCVPSHTLLSLTLRTRDCVVGSSKDAKFK